MSKTIRRAKNAPVAPVTVLNPVLSIDEVAEINARAAKLAQNHLYADTACPTTNSDNAPVGMAPSTAQCVSGNTLFDEVYNLTGPGQVVVFRSLANSALYSAIMNAHTRCAWDGPTEDDGALTPQESKRLDYFMSLPHRIQQSRELYEYAAKELLLLSTSEFDEPMSFDTMFKFVASNATQRNIADDMPDELLEAFGITRAQLRLIDADEQKRQAKKDAELRASISQLRSSIEVEVGGIAPELGNDEITTELTAEQHIRLFTKAISKLQARITQLIGLRHRYDGALGDAMLLSNDVKTLDKASINFRRRNAAELRDAA